MRKENLNMAVVYPAKGQERDVAKKLVELAGARSSEIRTTTDTPEGTGSVGFVVPDDIADKYTGVAVVIGGDEVEDNEPDQEETPRRRGRPRKATTAKDQES